MLFFLSIVDRHEPTNLSFDSRFAATLGAVTTVSFFAYAGGGVAVVSVLGVSLQAQTSDAIRDIVIITFFIMV